MAELVLVVLAIVEAAIFLGLMYSIISKRRNAIRNSFKALENELNDKLTLKAEMQQVYAQMVHLAEVADAAKQLKTIEDQLKAERGRITITQTELETVETRLCELEEIERELEASNLESEEELNVLKKKEADLKSKNEALKKQLGASLEHMNQVMGELQLSAAAQEKFDAMRSEIVTTQDRIESMLVQIEELNLKYFELKRRYDALDIEYAQLYEKFTDAEAQLQSREAK